jgi:Tol biopolymer transport system component
MTFLIVAMVAIASLPDRANPEASSPTASPDDGIPRPLANEAGLETTPSFSPDGSEVVYHWETKASHGIFVRSVEGGPARQIPLDADIRFEEPSHPTWSPRGDMIAFLAYDGPQRYGVFVVSPTGTSLRRLTSAAGIGLCWRPDGSAIGFIDRTSPGEPFSVYSISLETGQRRRLSHPEASAFGDTHCAFSPAGNQLAVIRHATRNASDLYVLDPSGTSGDRPRRLTWGRPGMQGLAWTPDGSAIVVGPNGLWSVSTVSTQPAELITAIEREAANPTFSKSRADGTARLAYEFVIQDVNVWRWDRRQDGSTESRRLPGSTLWDDFPALSPDGRQIAFVSNRTGSISIWVANADGTGARQLTFHGTFAIAPQWSPDGRRIVYASQNAGNWDLYLVDADGTNSKRLTWDPSQEENPGWSRDGRRIYFRSDRSGKGLLWRMSPDGGPAVQVTTGEASQGFESLDGALLYFVRSDDAPGLWSIPIHGGKENFVVEGVRQHGWGVSEKGIVFLTRAGTNLEPAIRVYDPVSRAITAVWPMPPAMLSSGFSVSRDGQSVFWAQTDELTTDLMVIDRWRREIASPLKKDR